MKPASILFSVALLIPTMASAADYNLGELAKANKIELFNRTLDQRKLIRHRPSFSMPQRTMGLRGSVARDSLKALSN